MQEVLAGGILTSTVGIGDAYSTEYLEVLAVHGGGRLHDAERPEEIIEVVLAELYDVEGTVIENVCFQVGLPKGASAECISGFPSIVDGPLLASAIGSLVGNAFRDAVYAVTLPAGQKASTGRGMGKPALDLAR